MHSVKELIHLMSDFVDQDDEPSDKQSYTTDTIFPSGYVKQQQPLLLSYVAARAGYMPPDPAKPFRYLELGCGRGTTLNGLAAANPESEFVGVDFNSIHVEIARAEAVETGLKNVRYIHAPFHAVETSQIDLFDYIIINGTYSWLDMPALSAVHHIVSKCLRPGGLFYVDYMAMPATAQLNPLWYFLRVLTKNHVGDSVSRAESGIRYLSSLRDSNSAFFRENPLAESALDRNLKRLGNNRDEALAHIAHHALAEQPTTYYFPQLVEALSPLGLSFAGSSNLVINDTSIALPPTLQALVKHLHEPVLTELVKDIYRLPLQRQDVFIKEARREPKNAWVFLWSGLRVTLLEPAPLIRRRWAERSKEKKRFAGAAMEFVLDRLAEGASCIEEIYQSGLTQPFAPELLLGALHKILATSATGMCRIVPQAVRQDGIRFAVASCAYNRRTIERALRPEPNKLLASPVLGACVELPPLRLAVLSIILSMKQAHVSAPDVVACMRTLPLHLKYGNDCSLAKLDEERIFNVFTHVTRWLLPKLVTLQALQEKNVDSIG